MQPFLIALQFLSILPVPKNLDYSERNLGRSPLWYPGIGLLLGGLLWLLAQGIDALDIPLQAALLLTAWVILSGGLHLDGLADSADAWLGGLGNRERTLEILHDPCSGPIGILAIGLVLLLKYAALQTLLSTGQAIELLLILLLTRSLPLLFLLTTPYARPQGLLASLQQQCPKAASWALCLLIGVSMLILDQLLALGLLLGGFWLSRRVMLQRLGGMTGDTLGASIELLECLLLLAQVIGR